MRKICPEIDTATKGQLNSKSLPHLKHLIVVKNKLVKDATDFKAAWSFEGELIKQMLPRIETPRVDFDDPLAILFTVRTNRAEFCFLIEN